MSTRLDPVQVGAQAGRLSDWKIKPVHFNGFAGLPTMRGVAVRSPEFSCFGHRWGVAMYPGGDIYSLLDGFVDLRLFKTSEEAIDVEFRTAVKNPNGGGDILYGSNTMTHFYSSYGSYGLCPPNYVARSTLMNYLVDGTLIVEVHMRTNKPVQQSAPFVPENQFLRNAIMGFGDEETADVKIEVGGAVRSGAGRRKRGKTTKTTFHAHHLVLGWSAPMLAGMCKPGDTAPIKINNSRPEIIKHLLYYCYGGKISKDDLESDAKDIIEAADRFGIASLKLEAEACLVHNVELTLDNIIEVVTYADSKNLALLKEHCMDFLSSANKMVLAENVSFADMPPHLFDEGFAGCAGEERGRKR